MGLDFVTEQVPMGGFGLGAALAVGLNLCCPPLDEVFMFIALLLSLKSALVASALLARPTAGQCLIPESKQRYDPDGKPYIRHRRRPEDMLVSAVIGFGLTSACTGYGLVVSVAGGGEFMQAGYRAAITGVAVLTCLAIRRYKLNEEQLRRHVRGMGAKKKQ